MWSTPTEDSSDGLPGKHGILTVNQNAHIVKTRLCLPPEKNAKHLEIFSPLQNLDAVVLIVANKFLTEGTLEDKEKSNIIVCAIIGLVVMVLFYAMLNNL